jgi:serine-type D-Ala-D-Ala endopeptidase (penicillin-binding protein 7)
MVYRRFGRIPNTLPEDLSLYKNRTSKFAGIGLTLLWLGLSPLTAGASPSGVQSPGPALTAPLSATSKATTARRGRVRSRRAAASAAKTRAAQRTLAEAKTPHYRVDADGNVVPDLRAAAAIIYDPSSGKVLWEEHSQDERSIASITKVMTAVVFLESATDLDQEVQIVRADTFAASTTYLRANDRVRLSDLLHLLLLPSDNAAARALARVSPLGFDGFIARMNQKAKDLGLDHTHYQDPSGLNADNVSSAYDMARLISYAAEDDRIGPIMRTPEFSFRTGAGRIITVHSTNQILRAGDVDVRGGKTGFIAKAGYCLATLLKLPQGGPSLAVVVLGANSNPGRFWETRHLLAWLSERAQLFGMATPAVIPGK